MKPVATFGRQWEADLAIAFLRENGCHPLDLETSPHITAGGVEATYLVKIPAAEFSRAREILLEGGYAKNLMAG